jgi:hypothetical protein
MSFENDPATTPPPTNVPLGTPAPDPEGLYAGDFVAGDDAFLGDDLPAPPPSPPAGEVAR